MRASSIFAWFLLIGAVGAGQLCAQTDPGKSFLDAEAILAGWESNYASIKTMKVAYSMVLVDYQPPTNDPNYPQPSKHWHIERIEQGKRYHLRYSNAEDGFAREQEGLYSEASYFEQAFNGKNTQAYWGSDTHGSIASGLTNRFADTENVLKEYMFLTVVPGGKYLGEAYPNGLPALSKYFRRRLMLGGISVRPNLERISGELCHVVELVSSGVDYTGLRKELKFVFWMAHDKGMCLMKYRCLWNDVPDCKIDVEEIAMANSDGNPVWYPTKVYCTNHFRNSRMHKYELKVKEFVPNIEVDKNTWKCDFPPGTSVLDRVAGISYRVPSADPSIETPNTSISEAVETKDEKEEIQATEEQTEVKPNTEEQTNEQVSTPVEADSEKNRILGLRSSSILGVIVLAVVTLSIWRKRSANT